MADQGRGFPSWGLLATAAGIRLRRALNIALACWAMLLAGCAANPPGNDSSQVIHTLRGTPVAFTHIVLGSALSQAHFSATSLWAIRHGPWFSQSQVRIDPETFEMVEFPRPFSGMGINFLADANSLWSANFQTSALGSGTLYRVDQDSNRIISTTESAGNPFAIGGGAVWAYNPQTRALTGIDQRSGQTRTRIETQGSTGEEAFTFGDGSIWQFSYRGEVSRQLARCAGVAIDCALPTGMVRRIDPRNGAVIAEIDVGPHDASDSLRGPQEATGRIRFVAETIVVLGGRDAARRVLATLIDGTTNQITGKIRLESRLCPGDTWFTNPGTPVSWQDGIWISGSCTYGFNGYKVLLKIDAKANRVIDELALPYQSCGGSSLCDSRHPELVAGAGALWGFDGRSVIRLVF